LVSRQAFWVTHVEALNSSGATVAHHATELTIAAHSVRRWRDVFEAGGALIDQCLLSPPARKHWC
jgi:hypothetical protein